MPAKAGHRTHIWSRSGPHSGWCWKFRERATRELEELARGLVKRG